jgi:hypothetical protein
MSWILGLVLVLSASVVAAQTVCETPDNVDGNYVCNGNGKCVDHQSGRQNVTRCVCNTGWAGSQCDYQLKNRVLVFLMSFFFGELGVDRFILGLVTTGVLKLLLPCCCLVPLIILCCSTIRTDGVESRLTYALVILVYVALVLGALGSFGWWLADVIMTGMNTIRDSNGDPLGPWPT